MRKSRKALLLATMLVCIAAGAALFFVIGTSATEVAREELKPTPTPKPRPAIFFGDLATRPLSSANLRLVASGFSNPHGIGFFEGTLYVSDWGEDKLFAVDLESGEKRLLADELGGAHDMVLDGQGRIVTPLFKEGRVVRIDRKSGAVEEIAAGLAGPNGIAKARGGGYYVTNAKDGTLVKLKDGKRRTIARGLKEPAGIVVDNDNIVRIAQYADPVHSVVQIFDNGKRSDVVTGLTSAESLLYDEKKNLLVGHVAGGKGTLTLFTSRGKFSRVLQTDLPGPLIGPVTDGKRLFLHSAAAGQTAIFAIPLPKPD